MAQKLYRQRYLRIQVYWWEKEEDKDNYFVSSGRRLPIDDRPISILSLNVFGTFPFKVTPHSPSISPDVKYCGASQKQKTFPFPKEQNQNILTTCWISYFEMKIGPTVLFGVDRCFFLRDINTSYGHIYAGHPFHAQEARHGICRSWYTSIFINWGLCGPRSLDWTHVKVGPEGQRPR